MNLPVPAAALPDHDWIRAHIPHAGRMCLLDAVLGWDAQSIRCRTRSHVDPLHPLRAGGRLGAACGIEYAAQAMAVHAALRAGPGAAVAKAGLLASVRELKLHVAALDDAAEAPVVVAQLLAADADTALYRFELYCGELLLLRGRAGVITDADAAAAVRP